MHFQRCFHNTFKALLIARLVMGTLDPERRGEPGGHRPMGKNLFGNSYRSKKIILFVGLFWVFLSLRLASTVTG